MNAVYSRWMEVVLAAQSLHDLPQCQVGPAIQRLEDRFDPLPFLMRVSLPPRRSLTYSQ